MLCVNLCDFRGKKYKKICVLCEILVNLVVKKKVNMNENEISKIVFKSALKVHRILGSGLLESAYEECLFYKIKKSNLIVE